MRIVEVGSNKEVAHLKERLVFKKALNRPKYAIDIFGSSRAVITKDVLPFVLDYFTVKTAMGRIRVKGLLLSVTFL